MDRSVGSPRTRSVVGVRGPGVSVFGLPLTVRSSQWAANFNTLVGQSQIMQSAIDSSGTVVPTRFTSVLYYFCA